MSNVTLDFNIEQEHIDKGKPREPDHCPVALSLTEHLNSKKLGFWAIVGPRQTIIRKGTGPQPGERYELINGPKLQAWIAEFDNYEEYEEWIDQVNVGVASGFDSPPIPEIDPARIRGNIEEGWIEIHPQEATS